MVSRVDFLFGPELGVLWSGGGRGICGCNLKKSLEILRKAGGGQAVPIAIKRHSLLEKPLSLAQGSWRHLKSFPEVAKCRCVFHNEVRDTGVRFRRKKQRTKECGLPELGSARRPQRVI